MDRRNISILIGILLLTALLAWIVAVDDLEYVFPAQAEGEISVESTPLWAVLMPWQGSQQRSVKVHQGLDLQGGLQVVLEADLPTGQELPEGAMEAARIIVDNRVNGLGVTEPLVQLQGDNRIIVELPGISDPELAISTIRETGLLEFVDAGLTPIPDGAVIQTTFGGAQPEETETPAEAPAEGEEPSAEPTAPAQVYETVITGGDLEEVSNAGFNPDTRVVEIYFSLKDEGANRFAEHTGDNIGRFLCIVLDKTVISCPVINARIDKNGTISLGNADLTEGQALAIQLRYGALPVPLKVVESRSVGPTLGQDSVQKSIRAGTIGLIVVLLFMIVYYRLPGFMAALAMVIYGLLNFGLYKIIPVTLTLPAITGFILSLGMAVDANILVFERLKEELRAGRTLNRAMELGFSRAWPSIRDSAVSTLITCAILFWFGSNFGASIVKGFAVTLALGVVTNIFTAVTVTRTFLRFMLGLTGEGLKNSVFLMGFALQERFAKVPRWAKGLYAIVDKRKWFYLLSVLVIIPGLMAMGISMAQFGSLLKPSIDFEGGSLMELQFEQPVRPSQVRQIFTGFTYGGVDYKDATVTTAEQLGQETILVRSKFLPDEAKSTLQAQLRTQLGNFEELRFDSVGPTIGAEVTRAGLIAVSVAAVAILLYLYFAFRAVPNAFRYGVAAVVAMLHDILVTAGFFAIAGLVAGWEIDALFLTAILTVIGYSVHDTIIVFDRIRENLPRYRMEPYGVVCNRSLLETLNRSVVTSLSTVFVVLAILLFGGSTIRQFTAIILVGIISGTYSSIFNAVPVLVSWRYGEFGNFFRRLIGRAPVEATT
ncbi:MAG: protein translocase subunit SecD [Anaerolineae bacterium]|nr:protein translocase subunit SecD [Anaerolineae bacterium]